jgi:hypothetical protein
MKILLGLNRHPQPRRRGDAEVAKAALFMLDAAEVDRFRGNRLHFTKSTGK